MMILLHIEVYPSFTVKFKNYSTFNPEKVKVGKFLYCKEISLVYETSPSIVYNTINTYWHQSRLLTLS